MSNSELLEVAKAMRAWIDAVPADVQLPTMPGFDRDWADGVIEDAQREVEPDEKKAVTILYTNYRGETADRKIIPTGKIWFGSTEWHTEKQWLLDAHDVEKAALRNFAIKDIKNWKGEHCEQIK